MPPIFSIIPTMQSPRRHTLSHKSSCHAYSSPSRHREQQMSNIKILFSFVLLASLIAASSALDEKTVKPAPSSSSASASSASLSARRDEIYIDDEGIEGSGGRGEIHDDLEKDPDYSGSGFGPDDEDSSTDHHQSIGRNSGKSQHTNDNDFITSRTSNSGTILGSSGGNTGSTGIIDSTNTGINSFGKDQQPHHHHQQQHTDNNPNNNHPSTQHTSTTTTTTTSSSLYPSKPNPDPVPPHSLPPTLPHPDDDDDADDDDDDDDDFDLDETIVEASGDGAGGRDDDDETGDDDIDEDIISRVHQTHDLESAKPHNIDHDHDRDDNDDIETEIDGGADIDDEIKQHVHPYPRPEPEEGRTHDKGDSEIDIDAENKDKTIVDGPVEGDSDGGDDIDDDDAGTDVYTDSTVTNEGEPKRPGTNQGTIHELDSSNVNSLPTDTKIEHTTGNEVLIMSDDDRTTSFFAQPGILAAVIGGAVVGLLCAILVVMFIVYRMRKKDEGSYALDEPKRSPAANSYAKNANNREFYA